MTKPSKKKSFLKKLNVMLNKKEYEKYINWDEKTRELIIENKEQFSKKVLPKCFNHNKYASFVRQLNSYGFKVKKHPGDRLIYKNELFYKNMPVKDLENIEAKNNSDKKNKLNINKLPISDFENNNDLDEKKLIIDKLNNCLNDLEKIINTQKSLSKEFESLKKINKQPKTEMNLKFEDIKTIAKQEEINLYKQNMNLNESNMNNESHDLGLDYNNSNNNMVNNTIISNNDQNSYMNNPPMDTNKNPMTTSRNLAFILKKNN